LIGDNRPQALIEGPQALFIDADDTLWENNIYFERAFDAFVEVLGHSAMSAAQVRASLDEIEHVNNAIHGYGSANFARNLRDCLHHLSERGVTPEDLHRIAQIEFELLHHPLHLINGVGATLTELRSRGHRMILCTKGDHAEQSAKIEASGLAVHFHEIEIVKEKNPAQYRALVETRGLAYERSWMIGNSPKSDILAPLEAGLGAVYVPHPHTWHLELAYLPETHPRLVQVENFSSLTELF
jgi:putative hydrolase of the HAD superfamily